MFKIAKEGYPFILLSASVTFITTLSGNPLLTIPFLILTLFMIFFFRDPERVIDKREGVFYSPADGRVIFIGRTREEEVLREEAIEVSIFMSPLDVHINRIPCDGVVREVRHYPGRFIAAYRDDSSMTNEHITMLIESRYGRVVVRQVAGFLARRAVCRVKPGDGVNQGQRYGMIKFSSRVDIYMPLNTSIRVGLNDRVRAGQTVIGVIEQAPGGL
jgi:phosphatidylserine decarboxylase